jgi:hypothetical protein
MARYEWWVDRGIYENTDLLAGGGRWDINIGDGPGLFTQVVLRCLVLNKIRRIEPAVLRDLTYDPLAAFQDLGSSEFDAVRQCAHLLGMPEAGVSPWTWVVNHAGQDGRVRWFANALEVWAAPYSLGVPWLYDQAIVTVVEWFDRFGQSRPRRLNWAYPTYPTADVTEFTLRDVELKGAVIPKFNPILHDTRYLKYAVVAFQPTLEASVDLALETVSGSGLDLETVSVSPRTVRRLVQRADPLDRLTWKRGPLRHRAELTWFARYQVDQSETYANIARDYQTDWRMVAQAIERVATMVDVPARPARPGRPRKATD